MHVDAPYPPTPSFRDDGVPTPEGVLRHLFRLNADGTIEFDAAAFDAMPPGFRSPIISAILSDPAGWEVGKTGMEPPDRSITVDRVV